MVVGEQERLRGEVQELTSSLAAARSRACDADAAAADSAAEVCGPDKVLYKTGARHQVVRRCLADECAALWTWYAGFCCLGN